MKCRKTEHRPKVAGLALRGRVERAVPRTTTARSATGSTIAGSRRGVALVLTLIMLAVITVVTVVFLATTRRNRQSTIVRQDQTSAENGAETGQQHAIAKIVERILFEKNLLAFDFLVSRPLAYGFETNNGLVWPVNGDVIPRVHNPSNTVNVFLDLDRNRLFSDPGGLYRPYGDPIWLGVLDKPWFGHSRTNQFKARYAYLILPVGKALDLNTIHNDTSLNDTMPPSSYGFMRNQGFGPWELNLAALFRELAPEVWDYDYFKFAGRPVGVSNAFADARSIVNYRHGWPDTPPLAPVPLDALSFSQVFYDAPLNNFPGGAFDVYADGSGGFALGRDISQLDDDFPLKLARFPGADTTNHFFHHQELFDHADLGGANGRSNKVTFEFYSNLTNAIARTNYGPIYYKLINILATQTGSDVHDKINLNFADEHAQLPGTNYSATNFVAWNSTPELARQFFIQVAERIFLAQSNEFNPLGTIPITSITNVPVFPTNRYSSPLHRILQEAANILDATTASNFPTVFLPLFQSNSATVFLSDFAAKPTIPEAREWMRTNVYGVPAAVGAKKNLPNFNEFSLLTDFLAVRKLQLIRDVPRVPDPTVGRVIRTNQMYIFAISNVFGVEGWNSYQKAYPGIVQLEVTNYVNVTITNANGVLNVSFVTNYVEGSPPTNFNWRAQTYVLPLSNQTVVLPPSYYHTTPETFASLLTNTVATATNSSLFEPDFKVPYLIYTVSNRLTYLVHDGLHVLDCVVMKDGQLIDTFYELNTQMGAGTAAGPVRNVWDTNTLDGPLGPTEGVRNQITISSLPDASTVGEWNDFNAAYADKNKSVEGLRYFMGLSPLTPGVRFITNNTTEMQTGFNPSTRFGSVSSWQANDPLVHYHPADLYVGTNTQLIRPTMFGSVTNVDPSTLGRVNVNYSPWGGDLGRAQTTYIGPESGNLFNVWLRDPGMTSSDEWQFPSNKLAGIGMLGRVHRGTPWQTIYFKAAVTNADTWLIERPTYLSHPSNDWKLPDMFTTALDERTSSGLMSINQTNMEAWSAALSGVLVLSNNLVKPIVGVTRDYDEVFIQPWGNLAYTNSGFAQIWNAIYNYQTDTNRGRPLASVGEFLQSVPELTTKSPFLNLADDDQLRYGLDDFAYEQIPQQILSLLRVGQARFVIYAYGQALKPERIDPATGRVDNYQVTAEYATRTVIRLEGDPRSRIRAVVESFNILPPD